MPLRDTRVLRDWALASFPSDEVWQRVHLWIVSLDQAPWRAPSAPDESRSDRPNYEVRAARLNDAGVAIEYLHIYNGDIIDIWGIEESDE